MPDIEVKQISPLSQLALFPFATIVSLLSKETQYQLASVRKSFWFNLNQYYTLEIHDKDCESDVYMYVQSAIFNKFMPKSLKSFSRLQKLDIRISHTESMYYGRRI